MSSEQYTAAYEEPATLETPNIQIYISLNVRYIKNMCKPLLYIYNGSLSERAVIFLFQTTRLH